MSDTSLVKPHGNSKLAKLSLQDVEDAYAEGGTHKFVASKLGISENHWTRFRTGEDAPPKGVDIAKFSQAIEKGCSIARSKVQAYLMKHAKNNVVGAIFLAKQKHLLDYADQRNVDTKTDITVTIKTEVLPPVSQGQIEPPTSHLVEGEGYTDIVDD